MVPPPNRTLVRDGPKTSSVMIGVGVGLLLNHQISPSTSTVNGPSVPEPVLLVWADATSPVRNSTPSAAAITFRMKSLPRPRLGRDVFSAVAKPRRLRARGAGVRCSRPAPRRYVQVHQRLSACRIDS